MFFSNIISAVVLTALAGRALAQAPANNFTVAVGPDGKHTVIHTATEVLAFNIASFPLIASCAPQCQSVQAQITACPVNITSCYCAGNLTDGLQACEACMYTALIKANKPLPDPLAGSNQVLTGWGLNCANASIVLPNPLGLSTAILGDLWEGPFVSVFPTPVGWVLAVTGGLLGSSLIYMLCQM
ncbi:hypothetical protein R3P38DRAFT_2930483 [Favolaschia claudopus]|uniref:Uncharacterized protein n=1 Tax=Favolaschia claudopus TaxID=2862362 RepID=A0AAW0BUM3_9AGAR